MRPYLGLLWPWETQHEVISFKGQRIKDKLYPFLNLDLVSPIIHFAREPEAREISPLYFITFSHFVMSSILITFDLHRTLWSNQGQVLLYPFGKQPPGFLSSFLSSGVFLSRVEGQEIGQVLKEINCQLTTEKIQYSIRIVF